MILWLLACVGTSEKVNETAVNSQDTSTDVELYSLSMEQIRTHLEALNQIALDNNSNRSVGTNGDIVTQQYITEQLLSYGYNVWQEPVVAMGYEVLSDPLVSIGVEDFEAKTFYLSTAGVVEGVIEGVDLQIPPGASANSSTSGCEVSDFQAFTSGNIALIQRGTCTFETKVLNAVIAGASAVVIFNEGQQGRTGIVEGSLGENESAVPVVGVSYQSGVTLSETTDLVQVTVDAEVRRLETVNIFAEPSTLDIDAGSRVLVGAHLDSVVAGPGINDNGSGTGVLLTLAEWMSSNADSIDTPVRFAWWGAEEVGLIGSTAYVQQNMEEMSRIKGYLNFDMLGSPNHAVFIYDGDGSSFGLSGPGISDVIESMFESHFEVVGTPYEATAFDGRSDYGPFIQVGVPAGGLFSGAEGIMTEEQQGLFGGEAGRAYDACYHQACDTIENIDWVGLESMANAIVNVTVQVSQQDDTTRQATSFTRPNFLPYKGHLLQY